MYMLTIHELLPTYLPFYTACFSILIHHLDAHICIILEKQKSASLFTINSLGEAYPLSSYDIWTKNIL